MSDPGVRREAANHLADLFGKLGQVGQQQSAEPLGELGGMIGQIQEFVEMPVELTRIFLTMSTELATLVLESLEQAGFVIIRGVTPL